MWSAEDGLEGRWNFDVEGAAPCVSLSWDIKLPLSLDFVM